MLVVFATAGAKCPHRRDGSDAARLFMAVYLRICLQDRPWARMELHWSGTPPRQQFCAQGFEQALGGDVLASRL